MRLTASSEGRYSERKGQLPGRSHGFAICSYFELFAITEIFRDAGLAEGVATVSLGRRPKLKSPDRT